MAVLRIVEHPDPILYEPTEDVSLLDLNSKHLTELIQNMVDTCIAADGLGLAANQIGSNMRVFVYRKRNDEFEAVLNPEIVSREGRVTHWFEACLSIPGESFKVKRYKRVTIKGFDAEGHPMIIKSGSKKEAFCFQHEIDHLNGITLKLR